MCYACPVLPTAPLANRTHLAASAKPDSLFPISFANKFAVTERSSCYPVMTAILLMEMDALRLVKSNLAMSVTEVIKIELIPALS